MPVDAYNAITEGLSLIRRAHTNPDQFSIIETYLAQIKYRFERNEWPAQELKAATEDLKNQLIRSDSNAAEQLSLDEIFQALNHKDLEKIGLNNSDFDESKINTRLDILYYWNQVNNIKGVFSQDLLMKDVDDIKGLYRYFAQMMSMGRGLGSDGKPLESKSPVVYEYWQLNYPKTAALNPYCVFSQRLLKISFVIDQYH